VIAAAGLAALAAGGPGSSRRGADATGAAAAGAPPEPAADPEAILRAQPNSDSYAKHLLYLTAKPHQTGTARDMELAKYVRDRFIEYGLEDVTYHDSQALMTYGHKASLEIVAPDRVKLRLAEDAYPQDKDAGLYADPTIVPFHGYAPSGDVTAEVVYANGGSPEDFATLDKLGIKVTGRIVIMRYSEPYSYRGYKLYLAEKHGALGAIIYSDPEDDGALRGAVYPNGPWGPGTHIQWGAVIYDWLGPGEPFTFHWSQKRDGSWTEGARRDKQLPKIPSLPLGPDNAAAILGRLQGGEVPDGWQGGLPFAYHLGPGPVRVHLRTLNDERIGTLRNVLGMVRGDTDPDRMVILGNHRDAWLYGAVDPSSGTAALLEAARALGALKTKGIRPRRTILFASWDGEEQLLGGSTRFVLDRRDELLSSAVAYINVDSAVAGRDLQVGATPALAEFMRDVAKAVPDPATGKPLYAAWATRSKDGVAPVGMIVGATDYTAFQEHLGIACIDMAFEGPYGVYHSMYDDFFWMSRFGDPGFLYGPAMARLMGIASWRLATAPLLPVRYTAYARAVVSHIAAVEARAPADTPLSLAAARTAARRWEDAAALYETAAATAAGAGPLDAAAVRRTNESLMQVERALTDKEGLEGRPFFKHLIYAPQPTYREELLPRLWEAQDRGDSASLPRHERELVSAFDRAAALMEKARATLPAPRVAQATTPVPAHAPVAAGRLEFARDVLPILEQRCTPCHFPGGVMHERLPFETEATSRVLGTKLFTRLRKPEDQVVVRAWLEQEAGAPRVEDKDGE
jgi:N-acetylated-alpha-linked acidic dipeptidase